MRWRWKRQARLIEPRRATSTKVLELETAKEILAEVFHARPSEVEEMIQIRLEKKSLTDETELWPATFSLGE
jgi:ribose 1,5-bisphosphokinase PhnN